MDMQLKLLNHLRCAEDPQLEWQVTTQCITTQCITGPRGDLGGQLDGGDARPLLQPYCGFFAAFVAVMNRYSSVFKRNATGKADSRIATIGHSFPATAESIVGVLIGIGQRQLVRRLGLLRLPTERIAERPPLRRGVARELHLARREPRGAQSDCVRDSASTSGWTTPASSRERTRAPSCTRTVKPTALPSTSTTSRGATSSCDGEANTWHILVCYLRSPTSPSTGTCTTCHL